MKNGKTISLSNRVYFLFMYLQVTLVLLLLISISLVPFAISQNTTSSVLFSSRSIDGQILYAPINCGTTYLINPAGTVIHSWSSGYLPGEGNILVFNNGMSRPNGWSSSVDEIIPPVKESGTAFGPNSQTWIYTADPPQSLNAGAVSGAERLCSDNTLICYGVAGRFFEVTSEGTSSGST